MILFADNDILLKLAGCDLLHDFLNTLSLSHSDICLAADAKFSLPRQLQKKLVGSEAAKSSLVALLQQARFLEAEVPASESLLDVMAQIDGLDGGESLLFLTVGRCAENRIATGDKRALRALAAHQEELASVYSGMVGKVYTLESSLLLLIQRCGFATVSDKVIGRSVVDGTLNLAFGNGRTEEHAIDCLSSEARPFLPFLVCPELVKSFRE